MMNKKKGLRKLLIGVATVLALMLSTSFVRPALAFQGAGCGGECTDCHSLDKEEAAKLLKVENFNAEVKGIRPSPVKGIWEILVGVQGKNDLVLYMDFAKKHLVEGRFTPLEDLGKPTEFKRVDLKKIPLDGALVMGDPAAKKKVIVFDDPECPYCKKLHVAIKQILTQRRDIAFYIKLYPLAIHPTAYDKSKTIVCEKSEKLLEDAFDGKKLPAPKCETDEVDNNIRLAKELGIGGTPAIILPDGRLIPGYVDATTLQSLVDEPPK